MLEFRLEERTESRAHKDLRSQDQDANIVQSIFYFVFELSHLHDTLVVRCGMADGAQAARALKSQEINMLGLDVQCFRRSSYGCEMLRIQGASLVPSAGLGFQQFGEKRCGKFESSSIKRRKTAWFHALHNNECEY